MPDSKKMDALKADAVFKTAKVTFRDQSFTIASPDEWLMDFAHYADRDKITLALEAALGAEQYVTFLGLRPKPTLTEAAQLMEQIVSAFGLSQGE
jgi:hypothetical protein